MILVTGGAYQGKRKFAEDLVCRNKKIQKLSGCIIPEIFIVTGETGEDQQFLQADIVVGLHQWIDRLLGAGRDPFIKVQELLNGNPQVVITMDQVGCGVVPMKACDRLYRETVGRIGCMTAEQAEQVYLLNCGIARRIK